MLEARLYADKIKLIAAHLAQDEHHYDHPLLEEKQEGKVAYVIFSSERGLCGGYNMNVMKLAQTAVDESVASGVETEIYAIGRKAADYFRKRDYTVFMSHEDFGGNADSERGRTVGNNAVDAFLAGTFDEVRIVYSSFVSTMTQRPVDLPLLPIAPEDPEGEEAEAAVQDYIWEPSQAEMFAILLPLYLRNRVFMTLSEAFTSEHAARMTSMSAATENAGEMIEALTLQRNRERQSAITADLLDIVGGANAL